MAHLSQDAKLGEILKIYRRVETLHPIASEMFASPELERMFWTTLTHDLHVIRERSQNLADGQITAVQKAFKVLMDEKADGNAAIEIYMDEILGLKIVPWTDQAQILAQAIQIKDFILNQSQVGINSSSATAAWHDQPVLPNSSTHYGRSSENVHTAHDRMSTSEGLFVSDSSEPSRISDQPHSTVEPSRRLSVEGKSGGPFLTPAAGGDENEMLRKLFLTYQKAKNDFHTTAVNTLERTKSAKFLRDTTENCIAYIASRENSPSGQGLINTDVELAKGQATLDEMRSTLQEARMAAEAGSGGKKRRFDEHWANVPEGPAKMRPSSVINSLGDRDPIPRGQTSEPKLGNHSVRRRIENRPSSKPAANTDHRPRRVAQSERTAHGSYPASAGHGHRRVFPMPVVHHGKRPSNLPAGYHRHNPDPPTVHGDCYRPSYR